MENTRHIHEVLEMLRVSTLQFTPGALVEKLRADNGEDVQFTTCGDHRLTPEEGVRFILERNKVIIRDGRIMLNSSAELC